MGQLAEKDYWHPRKTGSKPSESASTYPRLAGKLFTKDIFDPSKLCKFTSFQNGYFANICIHLQQVFGGEKPAHYKKNLGFEAHSPSTGELLFILGGQLLS